MSHMYSVSQPPVVENNDIVERLRDVGWCGWETQQMAADEIERLQKKVIELTNLLKESYGMTLDNDHYQGEPQ